jgi:hypothetical protein
MDFKEQKITKEKEICVICKQETEYFVDTPINQRKYYIEGCGQLCSTCWKDLGGSYPLPRYSARRLVRKKRKKQK